METRFRRSFERDLRKIRDTKLLERIKQSIHEIESAEDLSQLKGVLKKMKGATGFYRVRVGTYRIILEAQATKAEFVRVLPRGEAYRLGPTSAG